MAVYDDVNDDVLDIENDRYKHCMSVSGVW